MILGYAIFAADIKYSMYANIQLDSCAKYSNIYDIDKIDPAIKIRMKRDIGYTYDNFCIVSERFKAFCEAEKYHGVTFTPLPASLNVFWFRIHNIIAYDPDKKGTRFINYDALCNGYEEIIGATPACLKEKSPIPDGFFRSDICFGSFAHKHPLHIVGEETKQKLKAAGFKELDFDKILDNYEWQNKSSG